MRTPKPLPRDTATSFTTQAAKSLGITSRRLRAGDIVQPLRGVNTLAAHELSLAELCRTVQLRLHESARFSGITAAALRGVPLPRFAEQSGELHIAVARPHRAPQGVGMRGHSYLTRPGDTITQAGLRISSPERTWCELAAILPLLDLVAAGDFLIYHRLPFTSLKRLVDASGRFIGRRGFRKFSAALELLDERSESPQESKLRVILRPVGIVITANLPIVTAGGFRHRADLAIQSHRVIIEYQSDQYHLDAAAHRRDMTRISRLEADGWYVMQVNADDLKNPAELCARVRQVLTGRERLG